MTFDFYICLFLREKRTFVSTVQVQVRVLVLVERRDDSLHTKNGTRVNKNKSQLKKNNLESRLLTYGVRDYSSSYFHF